MTRLVRVIHVLLPANPKTWMARINRAMTAFFVQWISPMTLTLITGPAAEPVSLAQARAHLKLDATEEDALLTALLTAARATLEAETRRAFMTQSWRLTLDEWPAGPLELPLAPVARPLAVPPLTPDMIFGKW